MTETAVNPVARVVFALLVLASFAAFFVTQRLKHTPTVVQRLMATSAFSPVSLHHRVEHLSFRIKQADDVTVTIVDRRGDDIVTVLHQRVPRYTQTHAFWNGRLPNGALAPDGVYRFRVHLLGQGRSVLSPHSFKLVTKPPHPQVLSITPAPASAKATSSATPAQQTGPPILPLPGGGALQIRFELDSGASALVAEDPQVQLWRTDTTPPALVENLPITPGTTTTSWNGTIAGKPAPTGTYLVVVTSRDRLGNTGSSAPLPPRTTDRLPARRAGITVRYLGAQPPTLPVAAAAQVNLLVDARSGPYRWSIARVGASRPRTQGSATKPLLTVNAPGGISGLYLLGLATAGTAATGPASTAVPFVVQGPIHQPVLVVLPVITWLGTDPGDEDGDGMPDTLDAGVAVARERIFAGGLPLGFYEQVAPLLSFLDQNHLRYDLTTDLALAGAPADVLKGHSGVLLAGQERWLPRVTQTALAAYARGGGRVASLGVDSLLRSVTLTGTQLSAPTGASAFDAFGAQLDPVAQASGTITDYQDGALGLFSGGDGRFSGYGSYQATAAAGPQAQVISSAVTPDGRTVIVGERFGSGIVIRTGLPQLGSRLPNDPNAQALILRIWDIVSGRVKA